MPTQYAIPVPPASAQAFHAYTGVTNPGLVFDRFAPRWRRGGENEKKLGLQRVASASTDQNLLREWNTRWAACAQAANAEPFPLKTDWRFVAGLGRKGPLEVGFTFHRYGFPILPGSSVKGIARASALLLYKVREDDADFVAIFGRAPARGENEAVAQAGGAIFFDAIPSRVPRLELDVMNPHFPKYYQGSEPPTDWQSPVPVYFLTVAPNTESRFAVGWRGALDDGGRRLRDLAKTWLVGGLTELGAGAKTSAGYGYFVAPSQAAPSADVASQPVRTAQPVPPTPASISATPTQAPLAPPTPPAALVWRTGTVREYQPGPGRGRLVDDETGEELSFNREAIETKGWSPGKKHKVRYAIAQHEGRTVVVKVQKT